MRACPIARACAAKRGTGEGDRGAHGLGNLEARPFVGRLSHHDPIFQYNSRLYRYLRLYATLTVITIYKIFPRMDLSPFNYTKWSDRLAFDLALLLEGSGEDIKELIQRHKISESDLLVFSKDPVFLKKVEHYRSEVKEKGLTFRMKARAQAEELLVTSWTLIHSPDVSAAVKADLIKQTVRWGGLEPKDSTDISASGGGVRITINLNQPMEDYSNDDAQQVIEHDDIDSNGELVEPA